MRWILDILSDKWEREGRGVRVPGVGLLTHIVWADNVFFPGHSAEDVQCLFDDFTEQLHAAKMHWKNDSLEVIHTAPGRADNASFTRSSCRHEYKAKGVAR